jgi:hypothetical protein
MLRRDLIRMVGEHSLSVTQTSLAGRRRLSQAELDMMITAHERFLSGKPGGKRASLRFLDLSRLELVRPQPDRRGPFGLDPRRLRG